MFISLQDHRTPPDRSRQRSWPLWPVLICLITVTSLLTLGPLALLVDVAEYDEAIFLDVSHNIRTSGLPLRSLGDPGYPFLDHTPLYPYLLSILAAPGSAGLLTGRLLSALAAFGCICLVFDIGRRLSGIWGGFWSAMLLALNPFFAVYGFFATMEVPMVFFLLVGLQLLIRSGAHRRLPALWGAGLAFATAALLKETALPFIGLFSLYAGWRQRRLTARGGAARPWRSAIAAMAAVLLPTAGALGAWGLWAWSLSAAGFRSTLLRWTGSMIFGTAIDPRTSIDSVQWLRRVFLELLSPGLAIALLLALALWSRSGLQMRRQNTEDRAAGALAAGSGATSGALRPWLLVYLVGLIGLSTVVLLKELRHLITAVPVAALLAGSVVGPWMASQVGARRNRRAAAALVTSLVFLAASPLQLPVPGHGDMAPYLTPVYRARAFESDMYYNVLRSAGLTVAEIAAPDEVVAVVHEGPVVAYYAGRHYRILYTLTADQIDRVLESTRVLVWDEEVFLQLDAEQKRRLAAGVQSRFDATRDVQAGDRQVIIYTKRQE